VQSSRSRRITASSATAAPERANHHHTDDHVPQHPHDNDEAGEGEVHASRGRVREPRMRITASGVTLTDPTVRAIVLAAPLAVRPPL
jgi:hypothetical protein